MKITKITEGNITTYFYDGVKKRRHLKSPDGVEWWEEFDEKGNEIHYKDNDGCESWSEYDERGNEIHHKQNDGYEYWVEFDEQGNEIHFKDTEGVERMKKKKIVINDCFGGFSLSDEAFELYLEKKGIKYYKYPGRFYKISGSDYFTVPKEKYDRLAKKWYKEDGNYRRINEKNWYLSNRDIKRDDPVLVEVVEKLKDKANGPCAELKIVEIPDEVDWEIEEYDGLEKVSEKHRSWR